MKQEGTLELAELSPPFQAVFAVQIAAGMACALVADILGLPSEVSALAAIVWSSAGLAWLLEGRYSPSSRWLPIFALVAAILSISGRFGLPEVLALLAIPTVLAAILLGIIEAAATALIETALLLLHFMPLGRGTHVAALVVALIAIWFTIGIAFAVSHRLERLVNWSWQQYTFARDLLDESRNQQVALKQALADTAEAGRQLLLMNERLAAARRAAEEAERTKATFVANVSHELRTPLNMIVGFSEMITQAPETYGSAIPPALLSDLTVVLRNAQHLSSLIDDVLDLSQIEAKRMAVVKERVDMREIIEAAKTAVSRLFASKNLYLETEVSENLPPVLCDRTRIREVVLNLLSNAARFTEQGGVRVRVWQQKDYVVTCVADTGPGIAPEDAERIFQPFQQLDGSIRRRYGGSGLGLSISKAFVELHGGKMWLESQKGVGTSFYFQLPIDSPAPVGGSPARWLSAEWEYRQRTRPSLAPALKVKPRLVVQEAGQALRRLVSRYLDNVEVVPADTLEQALAEVSRTPSQILLINSASVTDVLRHLNDSAALPAGLPAVICSLPGIAEAADSLGVSDYLLKPVSRNQLLAALDRLKSKVKTVLIVDDEVESVRLLWRMLASAGRDYRVLTATDGEEALAIMHQQRPDVVLLDLIMPGMDGFRLLEARSQDAALRAIPVLVISARDPTGQPIVSNGLVVTQGGGLAVHQVLACIDAIRKILATEGQPGDPGQPRNQPD